MHELKPIVSKCKGEWFIVAGILMVVIASIVAIFGTIPEPTTSYFEAWEGYKAQKQALHFKLFEFFEGLGFLIIVFSSITTGIRSIRRRGISVKSIVLIMVGLSICLFNFYTLYISYGIGKSIDAVLKPKLEIMQQAINKPDLPLSSKSKLSKQYARDRYLYEGIKEQYFSETGKALLYEPTKEDLEFRDNKLRAKQMWDDNKKTLPFKLSYWIVVTISGCLLGLLTPIQKQ